MNSGIITTICQVFTSVCKYLRETKNEFADASRQIWLSMIDALRAWRRMGFHRFAKTHKFLLASCVITIASFVANLVLSDKSWLASVFLALFVISFLSDTYVVWIIKGRLIKLLNTSGWYEIFLSKIASFVLTGMGVYLIIRPAKKWGVAVALIWFILFALKRVFMAIGFGSMSADLVAVLESDSYIEPLPAVPPPHAPNGTGEPNDHQP